MAKTITEDEFNLYGQIEDDTDLHIIGVQLRQGKIENEEVIELGLKVIYRKKMTGGQPRSYSKDLKKLTSPVDEFSDEFIETVREFLTTFPDEVTQKGLANKVLITIDILWEDHMEKLWAKQNK